MRSIFISVFNYTALALLAVIVLPSGAQTAPKPKDKPEAVGPITAQQVRTSINNLKQLALALHNYNDNNAGLPTNVVSKDKKPLLSWRVQILPYMEQQNLYRQFKLDEPWDSEHNKKLIEKMPKVYAPVRGKVELGMTYYQAFGGSNGWLRPGASIPRSFPDGTSNTFLCAEAAKPVIWTKPDDLIFNGKDIPALGGLFDGRFHALLGDGSVQRFRKEMDADILRRLIDPADGMPLPEDHGEDKDPIVDE